MVEQSLSNIALYEHQCLENIQKLNRYAGGCDDQQQCIAIIEAAMVSITDQTSDNIPMSNIMIVPENIKQYKKITPYSST